MRIIQRLRSIGSNLRRETAPSPLAWRGAAYAVYALALALVGAFFVITFLLDFAWQKLPAFVVWTGVMVMAGLAAGEISPVAWEVATLLK